MKLLAPSYLRPLLLLVLIIGPLQAQTVFACAMMDTVMHNACCCDDHKVDEDCVDSGCDAMLESSEGPCCERSVEVSVDEDTRQSTPIVKSVEVRSDVDPPPAIVVSLDVIATPQLIAVRGVFKPLPIPGQSGSDTYLITQRLRI